METLTQTLTRGDSSVTMAYAPLSVNDSARYGHRGLLIDTSRHYLSINEIERMIDTLVMNKMNKLHWHLVDAQSFPFEAPSVPEMALGAYIQNGKALIYTAADIKSVTDYAHKRGVEVIFEVDVPGHAASWNAGKPELSACQGAYSNINNFALNPTLDETYETLQAILIDIVEATGSSALHLGGDEVVYGCWAKDPEIVSWMAQQGWTDYGQLYNYFVTKAGSIAKNLTDNVNPETSRTIFWEEVFIGNCQIDPSTSVIEVWISADMMSQVTAAGYKTISAPQDHWYLDHSANTWQVMYGYEPTVGLNEAQSELVIGGEVAMWGEHIDDNNIEGMVWPRSQAVAERLWSPASVNSTTEAYNRMLIQHCRMLNRGFQPGPFDPADYCATNYV